MFSGIRNHLHNSFPKTKTANRIFQKHNLTLTLKIMSILSFVILLISLIPILYASFYAHPLYDDFGFASKVHNAIINGGNIFDILIASFNQVIDSYFGWQGTFSAIFIFSLQPGVFSDNLYFLTTFIMVFSLLLSTFYFFDTVIVKWFGEKRSYSILISSLVLFLSMQFIVNKEEAFYWFNGSSYYTLFYSFSLTYFATIIRMYLAPNLKKKVFLFVPVALLSIIIGGGNYTTALTTTVIFLLSIIILIKNNTKNKSLYIFAFILLLFSFIISMLAPGNAVRAGTTTGMSAIKAIIMSVFYSIVYIGRWTKLSQVVLFIFLSPVLFIIAKKTKFSYRYPFIVLVISFLCFATQLTPPLFAMSSVGSGRQVNIYYYSYYLLIIFDIFYFSGWISKSKFIVPNYSALNIKKVISAVLVLLIMFLAGCLEYGVKEMTSIQTSLSIINGSLVEYDNEYNECINSIKSGKKVVNDIENTPEFFGKLDISENSDYWVNRQLCNYFNVEPFSLEKSNYK